MITIILFLAALIALLSLTIYSYVTSSVKEGDLVTVKVLQPNGKYIYYYGEVMYVNTDTNEASVNGVKLKYHPQNGYYQSFSGYSIVPIDSCSKTTLTEKQFLTKHIKQLK